MKALYRRYRPKTLREVVGQEQITTPLAKSIESGKIAHSYLFVGPRGTGKTSVARILAHEINQFPYELEDDYLDIIEIDAASNTGVDNIRDLREKAIVAPTKGKYKVYIIDEVHMLSKSAFNALLKTLEEPPEHVVFILATTEKHKVPITILSRSQVYQFSLADPSTMFDHLKHIAKQEKLNITDDALKVIVKRGGGSFRDSLSLLDQISTLSDHQITADLLNDALGLPQTELIDQLIFAYKNADLTQIRQLLRQLNEQGVKAELVANELIDAIITDPQPALLSLLDQLTEVSRNAYPDVKLLLALSHNQTAPATPMPTPVPRIKLAKTPIAKPKQESQEPQQSQNITEQAPPQQPERPVKDLPTDQIWQQILAHIQQNAKNIYDFLAAADYNIEGNTFRIYARSKFKKNLIDKKRDQIIPLLPTGYELDISAESRPQDSEIADIAAIMGGGEEVQIDD